MKIKVFLMYFFILSFIYSYEYPFKDPYESTVFSTPEELQYKIYDKVLLKERTIHLHDRELPEVFWYTKDFKYSFLKSNKWGKSPLIFLIAGTGGEYNASKNKFLSQVYHQNAYHVVSLPSIISTNFSVSASSTNLSGYIPDDTKDYYEILKKIYKEIEKKVEISDIYVSGYSLGGAQSLFLAKLDSEEKFFNFKKVLAINPPVNLYNSALNFDKMLPSSSDELNKTVNHLLDRGKEIYLNYETTELNSESIAEIYKKYKITKEELKTLIGINFRLAASDSAFASDTINNLGILSPRNIKLKKYDSMKENFKRAIIFTYEDYINKMLIPNLKNKYSDMSIEKLQKDCSLKSMEDFLKNAKNVYMTTNDDEIILTKDELQFLKNTFGNRGIIFPYGGHCGNLFHKDNVQLYLDILAGVYTYE